MVRVARDLGADERAVASGGMSTSALTEGRCWGERSGSRPGTESSSGGGERMS